MSKLEKLKKLSAQATSGHWSYQSMISADACFIQTKIDGETFDVAKTYNCSILNGDAEFITETRNSIDDLIEVAEAVEDEINARESAVLASLSEHNKHQDRLITASLRVQNALKKLEEL